MTASDYIQSIDSMRITDKSINDIWDRIVYDEDLSDDDIELIAEHITKYTDYHFSF